MSVNSYSLEIPKESLTIKREENAFLNPCPFLIILGQETISHFQDHCYLIGSLIGKAVATTYTLRNGCTITLKLRSIDGDNKELWMLTSNKCGGNRKCWGCDICFSEDEIKNTFHFHFYSFRKKKGMHENFSSFLSWYKSKYSEEKIRSEAAKLGLSSSPYFAEAVYVAYIQAGKGEEEFLRDLSEVYIGIDNLHNIRGWIERLIQSLKDTGRICEVAFKRNLKQYSIKLSDCSGGKLRYLILHFEKIIISALKYDMDTQKPITEQLRKVLSLFSKIVWIAYSPLDAQNFPGIRLLLHAVCFQLSLSLYWICPPTSN